MNWVDYALMSGTAAAATAIGWLSYKNHSKAKLNPSQQEKFVDSVVATSSVTRENRPAQQLPIFKADELFFQTRTQGYVERIRSTIGFSPENYRSNVEPLLKNFAEFVQLLPASQSHHHAQPGGLLGHLLEVAAFALTKRQGYKLPIGSGVEDQLRQAAMWSYAVLIGSLLHDIGKPISDVVVTLYGENPNRSIGTWSGFAGSMCNLHEKTKATHYQVDFPDHPDYRLHEKLSVSLLHLIVPSSGMSWLGSEPSVLKALLDYLNGKSKEGDTLAEIIRYADMTSVAENLKSGSRVRFANAKILPLIDRLMAGLKQVVLEGHVPLNRPGAAIYIDPDGQHLWMVAGLAADKVREVLNKDKTSSQDSGIPNDNTRLFDTWQEYGACITPPPDVGKNAVWWVLLEIPEPTPWRMVLTMLKFRIKDIYGDQTVPDTFKGTITPTSPNTERPKTQLEQLEEEVEEDVSCVQAADSEGQKNPVVDLEQPSTAITSTAPMRTSIAPAEDFELVSPVRPDSPETVVDTVSVEPTDDSTPEWMRDIFEDPYAQPVNNSQKTESAIVDCSNFSNQSNALIEAAYVEPVIDQSIFLDDEDAAVAKAAPSVTPAGAVQLAPNAPTATPAAPPRARWRKAGGAPRVNADAFVAWLQKGLGDGSIIYNESEAFVHFVPQGLLLLSPKAMKVYLDTNAFQGETTDKKGPLQALQRELEKAGYFQFNHPTKTFFHKYRVKTPADKKPNKVVKPMSCYLIPNPQAYILPLPAPNDILEQVPDEELAA